MGESAPFEDLFWKYNVGDVLVQNSIGPFECQIGDTEYTIKYRLWDGDDKRKFYYLEYEENGKIENYLASDAMIEDKYQYELVSSKEGENHD